MPLCAAACRSHQKAPAVLCMEMTPGGSPAPLGAAAANRNPRSETEQEARRGHRDLPKHSLGQAAGGTQHKALLGTEALEELPQIEMQQEEAASALRCLCFSLGPFWLSYSCRVTVSSTG